MTRNDTRIIHTDGLEEGIRCAMCTNPMANNRGCDGGCDINESMYKRVLDVIKKNILEQEPKTDTWSIKDVADTLAKHGLIAEQEPCEDAVSRKAVLDKAVYTETEEGWIGMTVDVKDIEALPPVNPQEPKFVVKSDGTIEQIKNCNDCLLRKEWEKIGKLLSATLEKQTEQEDILDKIDEIITDALDKSTDQKESQTLRWVLDKISEVQYE